jgi:hypothetical protein
VLFLITTAIKLASMIEHFKDLKLTFLLVCTHQYGVRGLHELNRLIESLDAQRINSNFQIKLVVLLQGVDEIPKDLLSRNFCIYLPLKLKVGLSEARNIVLNQVVISQDDFVLFPDDDCWYVENFFDTLYLHVKKSAAECLTWGTSETPQCAFDAPLKVMTEMDALRRTNSISFGLAGSIVKRIGSFDRSLGLGTLLAAAEDMDYAYRGFTASKNRFVITQNICGHVDFHKSHAATVASTTKYWSGNMFVTLKYFKFKFVPLFIYRLTIGFYLVLRGSLSFGRFMLPFKIFFNL